ncbi:hypothetical protein [Streptomyces sp. NPDC086777]|uniref:hypothetical protein n=1 Tax=Streptomyces sp. NPDC086777 TaxID=3154866 RepID=UPI00344F4750
MGLASMEVELPVADCEPDARRFMDLTAPDYAYMFGFLQTDGHLSKGAGQKGRLVVEISARDSLTTASCSIASYLADYGLDVTGVARNPKRNARDDVYNVLYMMERAQRLAADLYYPGCLALERKRTAAESPSGWVRPPGMRSAYTARRWSETEDQILLELSSPAAAADVLGGTTASCSLRLWRLRNRTTSPGSHR